MAPFDRAHTTLYSSSIVTMPLSQLLVFATPLYLAPPLGVKPSDLRNDLWCRKTRMLGLSDGERISMIRSACSHNTRVWQTDRQTDGQTDGIGVAYTRYSIYAVRKQHICCPATPSNLAGPLIRAIAYMLSRVKTIVPPPIWCWKYFSWAFAEKAKKHVIWRGIVKKLSKSDTRFLSGFQWNK